jgi:isoleucyl-tRNA synthetase
VGSIAELKQMGRNVPEDIELHRPYIDAVILNCPECGGSMKRTPEVIDCWFDSGAMPFAQWHYPFDNEDTFREQFPAKFISEAVDQTRGWFYSLMAISTLLFGQAPFENVIVLGHVQNKDGQKMSKSKGEIVDPMDALTKHGADAVRWYFYVNSAPWLNNRYYDEAVGEAQRKFMGTLWNTYAFYVLYAEIDQFDPNAYKWEKDTLSVMDRWVLSRLNTLIAKVDESLARYELTEPARAMLMFTDELSNWYVRRCRDRFWGKDMPRDKVNAYLTLHHILVTLAKLAAPFVPFMTELMYRNLVCGLEGTSGKSPISVHLCDYPSFDGAYVDAVLEKDMDAVLTAVAMGRAARNAANIKNRQPLAEMMVYLKNYPDGLNDMYTAILAEELNVKKVTYTAEAAEYTRYSFKPQLRTLGPKYGKLVPKIAAELSAVTDSVAVMDALKQGEWRCVVDGTEVILALEDVLAETAQREGYMAQAERDAAVVLDIRLTPELIEEGYTRELISKLQTMRKEAGYDVTDRIRVYYSQNDVLDGVFTRNGTIIAAEVLADTLAPLGANNLDNAYEKDWRINDQTLRLGVERIKS